MCGRYLVNTEDELTEIREILKEISLRISKTSGDKLDNLGSDVFPSGKSPIITMEKEIVPARWGFDKWDNKGVIFNARSEGVLTSKFFNPLLPNGRCIVPAKAYYEWKKVDKKTKDKYLITSNSPSPLFMAGLSKRDETNGLSFVVITKSALSNIEFIHDRMPLLLNKDEVISWLSPEFNRVLLESKGIEVSYNLQKVDKYTQQTFLDFLS